MPRLFNVCFYMKNCTIVIGWEQCKKSIIPVQITQWKSGLLWFEQKTRKFSNPMILRKMAKFFKKTLKRVFSSGKNQESFTLPIKSTSFWLIVWKTQCEEKSIALKIEEYEPAELNRVLEKFYAETNIIFRLFLHANFFMFVRFFSFNLEFAFVSFQKRLV